MSITTNEIILSGIGSLSPTAAGIETDGNGNQVFNVPSGATVGYEFLTDGATIAEISPTGAISGTSFTAPEIVLNGSGSVSPTVVGIETDGNGNQVFNVPSGATVGYEFRANGTTIAEISSTGAVSGTSFTGSEIVLSGSGSVSPTAVGIETDGNGNQVLNIPAGATIGYDFRTNGTAVASISPTGAVSGTSFFAPDGSVSAGRFQSPNSNGILGLFNVRDFGAVGDGATDDYAAFAAALSAAGSLVNQTGKFNGATVFVPDATYFLSAGLTIPPSVTLQGSSMIPFTSDFGDGTSLTFANAATPCVSFTAGNYSGAIKDICIVRSGASAPLNSIGISADTCANVALENVLVYNHYNGIAFIGIGPPTYGITAYLYGIHTYRISGNHIFYNGWAELYCANSRFGHSDDGDDLDGQAFLCLSSTNSGAAGPSSAYFTNCQFNQEVLGPSYWILFDDTLASVGSINEFVFSNCHIENISVAAIGSTSTGNQIQRVTIADSVFLLSVPFFDLNSATTIGQFELNGVKIYTPEFNLTYGGDAGPLSIIGGEIGFSASTITGLSSTASTNVCAVQGTIFDGGLTVAGEWASLHVDTPSPLTNTVTAANGLYLCGASGRPLVNGGYVPSVYDDSGSSLGAGTHMVTGTVTIEIGSSGTSGVADISFPGAAAFTSAPVITVVPASSGSSYQTVPTSGATLTPVVPQVYSVTASGFTVRAFTGNGLGNIGSPVNITLNWIAVGS